MLNIYMIILGLNQIPSSRARKHDSAVTIICDGKVVASAEEERFNRIMHTNSQATQALEYCLNTAGVSLKDIDIVAISNNPYLSVHQKMLLHVFLTQV